MPLATTANQSQAVVQPAPLNVRPRDSRTNPSHFGHYMHPTYPDNVAVTRVMSCVPANETLGTHDEWYAAMAISHPNETIGAPEYAKYLMFADDYPNADFQQNILPALRNEIANGTVSEICRSNRVAVYRRADR